MPNDSTGNTERGGIIQLASYSIRSPSAENLNPQGALLLEINVTRLYMTPQSSGAFSAVGVCTADS